MTYTISRKDFLKTLVATAVTSTGIVGVVNSNQNKLLNTTQQYENNKQGPVREREIEFHAISDNSTPEEVRKYYMCLSLNIEKSLGLEYFSSSHPPPTPKERSDVAKEMLVLACFFRN